jgi:hypothetical protein
LREERLSQPVTAEEKYRFRQRWQCVHQHRQHRQATQRLAA